VHEAGLPGKNRAVFNLITGVFKPLGVAHAACAFQVRRVVLQGDMETMKSSDIVRRAYLGG
jgi:hypothetical protein